jgi:hypothetical protein
MQIDLFRNKEIQEDENPYEKKINAIEVFEYVKSHIEFNLTEQTWIYIDNIFSEIWNSKIGLGGSFYWDEIENEVLLEFRKLKILLPDKDVKTTVRFMLEYIEQADGMLD